MTTRQPQGKLGLAIRELHRSEMSLAEDLLLVSDRHHAEHEVHHVARDLARWSQEHVQALTEEGNRYGLRLGLRHRPYVASLGQLRQKVSDLTGRRPEPGVLLLADLRRLHRKAAGVSVDWELLAQGAQAAKDTELLALAQRAHPQTLRQLRWTNASLKVHSPQVLAT